MTEEINTNNEQAGNAENPKPDAPGEQADDGKQFSQQELNSIVADRLARKEKSLLGDIQEQLGVSLDEAKAIIKAKREQEEAEKSELERLQGELEKVRKEAETAKQREARIIRETQLKDTAVKLGFNDPADAIAFLDNDRIKVEEGKVTNAEELLKELADNKPYLIKRTTSATNPTNPGANTHKESDIKRARRLIDGGSEW